MSRVNKLVVTKAEADNIKDDVCNYESLAELSFIVNPGEVYRATMPRNFGFDVEVELHVNCKMTLQDLVVVAADFHASVVPDAQKLTFHGLRGQRILF